VWCEGEEMISQEWDFCKDSALSHGCLRGISVVMASLGVA
jgi:hypothetical protein